MMKIVDYWNGDGGVNVRSKTVLIEIKSVRSMSLIFLHKNSGNKYLKPNNEFRPLSHGIGNWNRRPQKKTEKKYNNNNKKQINKRLQ